MKNTENKENKDFEKEKIKRGDIVILANRTSCFVNNVNYDAKIINLTSIDGRIIQVNFELDSVRI